MKKFILSTILAVAIPSLVLALIFQDFTNLFKKETKQEIFMGDQASFIVLTGSGNKYLKPVGALWGLQWAGLATSTNGCLSVNSSGWISPSGSVCGGASADWNKQTNYGVLNLTASTTIPYWAKDAFYASSTSVFQGLATFGNASTSQISATNSYLGTVLTGTWNGTAISNAYVDDDITLTNITQITNRAITDLTGTLLVANGGTGQITFTSSQLLYGNGSAALSSVATTSLTGTAPMVFSNPISVIGGSASVLTCSAASGSVAGCLSSTDWTTFNNKQATISATWPIQLSGATLSFGGLSTSTAAVVGNIPYFSGVNTFANVATTTLTATSPLSLSQPISVLGSSASALTISLAGDWTGTIDSNNFAGGAIGAGELIYGGSAGSFSELALGTNGYVLALSGGIPAWVATTTLSTISGTLDISAQSNLTCGTNCTLTGDDISVDDAFILNTGDVGTGAYDFGGASAFEIVNGASPTVDATGELAVDTTSDQFVYYGASEKKQIVPFYTTGFTYATTSWTATTTIFMAPAMAAQTWNTAKCETSVGTLNVVVNDGTNNSNLLNASTTIGTFTLSSNNSFTSSETIRVDIGTPASSPVKIACRFKYVYDAD